MNTVNPYWSLFSCLESYNIPEYMVSENIEKDSVDWQINDDKIDNEADYYYLCGGSNNMPRV